MASAQEADVVFRSCRAHFHVWFHFVHDAFFVVAPQAYLYIYIYCSVLGQVWWTHHHSCQLISLELWHAACTCAAAATYAQVTQNGFR